MSENITISDIWPKTGFFRL